ncbi:ABC transporter transmembrane region-domain-containing protein [Ilyonectria destructans]|nr:ABC transporter transmembrane region-domain-containing protein [Ilyonectria destructans]
MSSLRSAFLRAALQQDIAFFDYTGTGRIAVRVTTNANLIHSGIAEKLGLLVQSIAMIIGAMTIAMITSWKLSPIALSIIPPMFVVLGFTLANKTRHETTILSIYSATADLVEEVFSSIKTVHALVQLTKSRRRCPFVPEGGTEGGNRQCWRRSHDLKVTYPSRPDIPVLKGVDLDILANNVTTLEALLPLMGTRLKTGMSNGSKAGCVLCSNENEKRKLGVDAGQAANASEFIDILGQYRKS